MAEAEKKLASMMIPAGGIAIFVERELEEEPESDGFEEYGNEGIAQFPALTKKMAAMGREGDDTIAHVQTGELIIPADFFKDDPEFKEAIFQKLRDAGVEDPERYVVGSSANSINPETGAPEFFKFLKNIVKGIGDAVKSVVKGVVNVVKKVAPVILPIALSFTPLGPIYGAALGSGIGTLIQGGSIKDALKSALISGATGAVFSGFTGGGSFTQNVGEALANPVGRFGQTISGAQTSLSNVFGGEAARAANAGKQTFFSKYQPTPDLKEAANQIANSETIQNAAESQGNTVVENATGSGNELIDKVKEDALSSIDDVTGQGSFKDNIVDAFTPGGKGVGESLSDAFFPKSVSEQSILQAQGLDVATATSQQIADATARAKLLNPGMLRTYGPMAALGTGAAAAVGAFETPEATPPGLVDRDEDGNLITGEDLIAENPTDYLIGDLGQVQLNPETGEYEPVVETQSFMIGDLYQPPEETEAEDDRFEITDLQADTQMIGGIAPTFNPNQYFLRESRPGGPFARPQYAADGGQIYPRRNGGIMPNEGVAGEDSVPAMLMPGEFVMTTDAVKGLGNGDMQAGIRNMYTVMANLERRGQGYA